MCPAPGGTLTEGEAFSPDLHPEVWRSAPPHSLGCPLKLSSHLCKWGGGSSPPLAPEAVVKGRVHLWGIALKSDRALEWTGQAL